MKLVGDVDTCRFHRNVYRHRSGHVILLLFGENDVRNRKTNFATSARHEFFRDLDDAAFAKMDAALRACMFVVLHPILIEMEEHNSGSPRQKENRNGGGAAPGGCSCRGGTALFAVEYCLGSTANPAAEGVDLGDPHTESRCGSPQLTHPGAHYRLYRS